VGAVGFDRTLGIVELATPENPARDISAGWDEYVSAKYSDEGQREIGENVETTLSILSLVSGGVGLVRGLFGLARGAASVPNLSRGGMLAEGSIATRPISQGSVARRTRAIENRLGALGIPEDNICIPEYGGRGFYEKPLDVGSNVHGVGINVDAKVLQ